MLVAANGVAKRHARVRARIDALIPSAQNEALAYLS
jgi:hypothetical protein